MSEQYRFVKHKRWMYHSCSMCGHSASKIVIKVKRIFIPEWCSCQVANCNCTKEPMINWEATAYACKKRCAMMWVLLHV